MIFVREVRCEGSVMFHGVHSCRLAVACIARGDVSVKGGMIDR
jgi:hypothetical protein